MELRFWGSVLFRRKERKNDFGSCARSPWSELNQAQIPKRVEVTRERLSRFLCISPGDFRGQERDFGDWYRIISVGQGGDKSSPPCLHLG